MTCGVLKSLPEPRTATAARMAERARLHSRWDAPELRSVAAAPGFLIVCLVALVFALFVPSLAIAKPGNDGLPEGTISAIEVEGHVGIDTQKIRAKLLSKRGGPLDARTINTDILSLQATKWFSKIDAYYDQDPKDPSGKSYILYFVVKEMPVLTSVEFRGLKKLKLKEVQEVTGLKKDSRADATKTRLAIGAIKRLYEEKGFELAEVELLEGGNPGDTKVVIGIFEGKKFYISKIDFEGNVFATDSVLQTKISSKVQILGVIGGKYHRDALEEDARKLKEYYQAQGFFEVAVTPVTHTGLTDGDVRVTYVVSEGTRYRVRNISFEGNKKIHTDKLREGLTLHSGQPILDSVKEADRKSLIAKYNSLGCIDTQILPEPHFTDVPGVVDIVYKIEEGEPYLLGHLDIHGNERTQDKVIRREFCMMAVLPGEPLDMNRLEGVKKRLQGTGLINTGQPGQGQGKPLEIKVVNKRPHDKPYGDLPIAGDLGTEPSPRMQSPDSAPAQPVPAIEVPRVGQANAPAAAAGPSASPSPTMPPGGGTAPFGAGNNLFSPPPDTPPIPVPIPGPGPVAAPPGAGSATPPIGAGEPPGVIPSFPGLNVNDVGPDRQDPFPGRNYADLVTSLEEAPTGRFMLGVGASSYQGLSGNLTISEKNFDLFNIPRSWNDFTSGSAFRGAGQQLTINLMPGTLINKFEAVLREPYLFDLPIGASGAGYLFQRIYPNWTEARGGGRFSLGRQLGTMTYTDVAVRAENVDFYGFRSPAPADYLAAAGHTVLASIRPSIRFDNRNTQFMPNKGQYLEFSFEEGFGTFMYPKIEVEGRSYFTLKSRPDGSGKQILTFRGHIGATGRDTPVYERFYAGNFGSLRGFQYRGVGPRELGQNVGGVFEALGSVEYQFPLSANDMFNQVVFCDFGTVNSDYNFDNMRVSVGTGLRMVIPAFGPLPLCFDLAFPVLKNAQDRVMPFNFTIGAYY